MTEPLKSSQEILTELFDSFNAAPPTPDVKAKAKDIKKETKKKKKKKEKSKKEKEKKKKKKKRKKASSDEEDSAKKKHKSKKSKKKRSSSREKAVTALDVLSAVITTECTSLLVVEPKKEPSRLSNGLLAEIKSEPEEKSDETPLQKLADELIEELLSNGNNPSVEKIKSNKSTPVKPAGSARLEGKSGAVSESLEEGEITDGSHDLSKENGKRSSDKKDSSVSGSKHEDSRKSQKSSRKRSSESPEEGKTVKKARSRDRSSSPHKSRRSRERRPRRSRSKSREKTKQLKTPRERERRRERSREKTDSRGRRSRSPKRHTHRRSRSRSRKRSRTRTELSIDKNKLLEIARKNALNMFRQGASSSEHNKLAAITAGGKTVDELTDFCKLLAQKDGKEDDSPGSKSSPSSDSDNEKPFHHPFLIKDRPNNINCATLPTKTHQEKTAENAQQLRLQFPVSSGQQHRKTDFSESEWVPVAKAEKASSQSSKNTPSKPQPPASNFVNNFHDIPLPPTAPPDPPPVFAPQASIDIGEIVSKRLNAIRRLQDDPHDFEANLELEAVQSKDS